MKADCFFRSPAQATPLPPLQPHFGDGDVIKATQETMAARALVPSKTLTGQVVHARKCFRSLFFLDIRLDSTTKHQVLFRSDDGSLSQHELEDLWRGMRRGDMVRVTAGEPLNPAECEGKDYPVSQGLSIEIVERYTGKAPFVQEQAMGTKVAKKTTVVDGVERKRAEMPCKFWLNMGRCDKGNECLFLHPVGEELVMIRGQWVEEVNFFWFSLYFTCCKPTTSSHRLHALLDQMSGHFCITLI